MWWCVSGGVLVVVCQWRCVSGSGGSDTCVAGMSLSITFEMELCGCKQATAHAHLQPHGVCD